MSVCSFTTFFHGRLLLLYVANMRNFVQIWYSLIAIFFIGLSCHLTTFAQNDLPTLSFNTQFDSAFKRTQNLDSTIKHFEKLLIKNFESGNLNKALDIADFIEQKQQDKSKLYLTHLFRGNIYLMNNKIDESLFYYRKAESTVHDTDEIKLSRIYSNYSMIYREKKKFGLAIHFGKKSYKLKAKYGEGLPISGKLVNLSILYHEMNQLDSANYYLDRALANLYGDKSSRKYVTVLTGIGMSQLRLKKYNDAIESFQEVISLNKERKSNLNLSLDYYNLALTFESIHNLDSAKYYYTISRNLASNLDNINLHRRASSKLIQLHIESNDKKLALKAFEDYAKQTDKIYQNESTSKTNRELGNYTLREEKMKTEMLQEISENQRNIIVWETLAFIILLIAFGLIYFYQKKKLGYRKKQVELHNKLAQSTETLRKQKKELKSLNKTLESIIHDKDNLISILSHDLRSPLAGILSLMELIEQEKNLNSREQEYLNYIKEIVNSAMSLMENILYLRLAEKQAKTSFFKEINIHLFIQGIVAKYQAICLKQDLKIHLSLTSGQKIITHPDYLRSVIENLISNALKYSETGKQIWVDVSESNRKLVISVRDEGIGIKEVDQQQLFEKFSKVSKTKNASDLSSGLGLYLVKTFVQKLEGEVTFESEVGKGSTFTVTIPYRSTIFD